MRSGGATLVEVAVALLLISIGAIGLAGLQIEAKAMGFQALQRSHAAVLAGSILERIRANRSQLSAYAVRAVGAATGRTPVPPAVDCSVAACDPGQLRDWDLWQWQRALDGTDTGGSAGGLVRATGCIGVSERLVTVSVAWQARKSAPDPNGAGGCGAGNYGEEGGRQVLQLVSFVAQE